MVSLFENGSVFLANHLDWAGAMAMILIAIWSVSSRKKRQRRAQQLLNKAIKSEVIEPVSLHPEINARLCAGCGTCTRVCPEGEVLQLINHRSVLVAPTKCVGHGECERACPMGAITLVFGTKTRGMDIPRISSNYETNVTGLYIAGELGGMGLIRNATRQGQLAAKHAIESLRSSQGPADVDMLIVGAGPAGLSASLMATFLKKSYVCIEQNSFGGTVANFPRQKVVMTLPTILPIVGALKFKNNRVPKEELLECWNRIRRRIGLAVEENTRFEGLQVVNGGFEVKTNRSVIRARKVILALGVRGSPRKLGLPNENLPKVTYSLVDPGQYRKQAVAVVGGGNSSVEAAISLAREKFENMVTLLVRGSSLSRTNDDNKRRAEALAEKQLLKIQYNSQVKEIREDSIIIEKGQEVCPLRNDYLFVMAGAEMPHKFLMSLGVQIEKKFGEALAKAA